MRTLYGPNLPQELSPDIKKAVDQPAVCHDLAKQLSQYLYFFSFSFLLVSDYYFSFCFILFFLSMDAWEESDS